MDPKKASKKKRKRLYRQRVRCETCKKECNSDYQETHISTNHGGKKVKFTVIQERGQKRLRFEDVLSSNNIFKTDSSKKNKESESVTTKISMYGNQLVCSNDTDLSLPGTSENSENTNLVLPDTAENIQLVCSDDTDLSLPGTAETNHVQHTSQNQDNNEQESRFAEEYMSLSEDELSVTIEEFLNGEKSHLIEKEENKLDGPSQPRLKSYHPKFHSNETFLRDFNHEWFGTFPWLSFSVENKVASCYACDVYTTSSSPFTFTYWKKPERLNKHQSSEAHINAMLKWMTVKAANTSTVHTQIDSQHKASVKKNREYLQIIIECLMFTAQQNIGNRGTKEERKNIHEKSDSNRGNFLELLHMRSNDLPWLKEMLTTNYKKRHQWTSPPIQRELLSLIKKQVVHRIVQDVKKSGMFAVIVDETSDVSRTEQVSLCLSYMANGSKKETFVGFYDTESTEGEALYKLVTKAIGDLDLNLEDIVGQCYDGAANMSGIHKGLAARMKETSPFALYIHCYAHLLNLAIQDTMANIEPLRHTLATIQSLYNFLEGSPKRHALFHKIKVNGKSIVLTLKSLCVTRWSCHKDAVEAIFRELEAIVEALLTLAEDTDTKIYKRSVDLLNNICDFHFIFGLCVLRFILTNTNALSIYLQGKDIDVYNARKTSSLTIEALKSCRIENFFFLLWKLAETISSKIRNCIDDTDFSIKEARISRRKGTQEGPITPE